MATATVEHAVERVATYHTETRTHVILDLDSNEVEAILYYARHEFPWDEKEARACGADDTSLIKSMMRVVDALRGAL